jgi:CRISPR system Cascade subunit CasC
MNERFLQLHFLTFYPPSNVNRDDLGRPKTAVVGGAIRLRISSQALKRTWRTSDVFQASLENSIGTRTKELGNVIYKIFIDSAVSEKDALTWATTILSQFGKVEEGKSKSEKDEEESAKEKGAGNKKKAKLSQLVHFSPEEEASVLELARKVAERKSEPKKDELEALLKKEIKAADIALFGRMLADSPRYNVEAAAQVAHAITTHKVAIQDDYFTAVDDLNTGEEDRGSSHLGVSEFGSGLFYTYICVNREDLVKNLQGDSDLAKKTLRALIEAVATTSPSGKKNSFAHNARAVYVMAELGNQQPRSLSLAFLKPINTSLGDVQTDSIEGLEKLQKNMDQVYGKCADKTEVMSVVPPKGSLQEIIEFSIQ